MPPDGRSSATRRRAAPGVTPMILRDDFSTSLGLVGESSVLPWQQEDQDHTPVLKQWVAIASFDPRSGTGLSTVLAARRLWNDCRMGRRGGRSSCC